MRALLLDEVTGALYPGAPAERLGAPRRGETRRSLGRLTDAGRL